MLFLSHSQHTANTNTLQRTLIHKCNSKWEPGHGRTLAGRPLSEAEGDPALPASHNHSDLPAHHAHDYTSGCSGYPQPEEPHLAFNQ